MDVLWNKTAIVIGVVGGLVSGWLGGMDNTLHALIVLMICDYITGLIKAIKTHSLSSSTGFQGILKKIMMLIAVGVAVELGRMASVAEPLRNIVIVFYIANEGISLLENISEFVPLPEQLAEYFKNIRNEGDKEK